MTKGGTGAQVAFSAAEGVDSRHLKTRWRHVHELLVGVLTKHVALLGRSQSRVLLMAREGTHAQALQQRLACHVEHHWPEVDAATRSYDAAVLVMPDGLSAADRVALVRRAHRQVEAMGNVTLLANVVADRSRSQHVPPAAGSLLEEVWVATGMACHLEDVRAIRWRGEQLHRALLLNWTSLRREDEW